MLDNRPNAFKIYTVDLGCDEKEGGVYKEDIDAMLTDSEEEYGSECYICHQTASYKLIAKNEELETEYLRKYGYICENCKDNRYVDPSRYALKRLNNDNGNPNMMLI